MPPAHMPRGSAFCASPPAGAKVAQVHIVHLTGYAVGPSKMGTATAKHGWFSRCIRGDVHLVCRSGRPERLRDLPPTATT